MLGPPKERELDRSVLVSLERLVPADHFYRHLHATLDLSFVRDWVKDLYADRGRPSIDPVVFFKLQLIAFFERIHSERKLIEIASLNLAHRWYVGYHLDEPLPDHSSLTRIRQRLGLPIFRRFFERIVQLCLDAGLVQGKDILFDATKVEANASLDSLVPRLKEVINDHLIDLFGEDLSADTTPAIGSETEDEASPGRWDLLEECRLDPARPPARGYTRLSDERISRTDPDATLMRARIDHPRQLGYHTHYAVDGGRKRIILHALVSPANVMENAPMLDQLRRLRFRWHLHSKRAIADTTYGTTENIVGLEDMGIQAYVHLPDWDKRTPYFGSSLFAFDPEHDRYVCPQGEILRRDTAKYIEDTIVYRAQASVCNTCPVKASCTESQHGRTVHRSFDEEALDRVRARHGTPRFEWAMRKRKAWIESLFGEAKQWHGMRRFRLRRLWRVNIEALLIAAGQNLKRLLQHRGWGRRAWPGLAAPATVPFGVISSARATADRGPFPPSPRVRRGFPAEVSALFSTISACSME